MRPNIARPKAAFAQDATPEEIIVTAQKRAENIQDTPISIMAVSAEALQGCTGDYFSDELTVDVLNQKQRARLPEAQQKCFLEL